MLTTRLWCVKLLLDGRQHGSRKRIRPLPNVEQFLDSGLESITIRKWNSSYNQRSKLSTSLGLCILATDALENDVYSTRR